MKQSDPERHAADHVRSCPCEHVRPSRRPKYSLRKLSTSMCRFLYRMKPLEAGQRPVIALLALPVLFLLIAVLKPISGNELTIVSDVLSIVVASIATVLAYRTGRVLAG